MDCGQVDKYSSGVPFTGKIAEIAPPEQQIQKMLNIFTPIAQGILDAIAPLAEQCIDLCNQLWDGILKSYPDKRVVWLAFCHKKAKVRKKNRNRILEYMKKELKRDES